MSDVEENVIKQIRERAEFGLQKYGVDMMRTDLSLRDWLQHALEETLDQAVYLQKAIMILDSQK